MHKLSICIPTYNRAIHLMNCLKSIIANNTEAMHAVQICISDNCSTDETAKVVSEAARVLPIKYERNAANLGLARNLLRVVEMADGEFVWLIGDDDLLAPGAVDELIALLNDHEDVDYFYVNSYHLTKNYVLSFPQPFALSNLPSGMSPFSPRVKSGEMRFLDLIDPRISFDFLGGMFLSVFRRDKWMANVNAVDRAALSDSRLFSHFDNTFPNIKIFSRAFAKSKAYFYAKPLSVCLSGVREWAEMYPLVKSVRLVEALGEYRKNGLSWPQYVYCKNAALSSFGGDFLRLVINRKRSGFSYVNPLRLIASNLVYPNFYLSFVYPLFRRAFWHKVRTFCTARAGLLRKSGP